MEKRHDIFYYLKDHSILPPAEVTEKLRHLLSEAPEDFQYLREHPVTPPPELKQTIMQRVSEQPRQSGPGFLRYAAAAAIVALLAGTIWYTTTRKGDGSRDQKVASQQQGQKDQAGALNSDPASPVHVLSSAAGDSSAASSTERLSASFTLDDEKYPLTGHSLLATFTSYDYPALKGRLDKTSSGHGLRIHADHYTNIALSPAMVTMLRACYTTRPDGSLAHKAKKTRQLLQRWSEQDRKQFAPRLMANPLDPVDLAEFLFPPLFSFVRHTPSAIPSSLTSPDTSFSALSPAADKRPITVSYTLTVLTKKSNAGIGETYTGGMQTLFDAGNHARLRLASLMRIQSIFFSRDPQSFTILTESMRPMTPAVLTSRQWISYNRKYAGETVRLMDDTSTILDHLCRKAVIRLRDGREMITWYTPDLRSSSQPILQPAFAALPGLVLQYEYTCRRKTLKYTATSISHEPIDPSVFAPPVHLPSR